MEDPNIEEQKNRPEKKRGGNKEYKRQRKMDQDKAGTEQELEQDKGESILDY